MPASGQKVYTVKDVPNVQLADRNQYVSNPDGTLSPATVDYLNGVLRRIRSETSVEAVVVVISTIGEESPEDFALGILRGWENGKEETNNGLVILLATDDRIVRF